MSIDVDIDEELLPLLRADELRFKQIVLNLLSNAVKFTPPEGTVTVRFWYQDFRGFVLQIADTGIGIDEIPEAFGRFQQGADAQEGAYEGIGLGLPFTESLVERHGGTTSGRVLFDAAVPQLREFEPAPGFVF